MAFLDYQIDLVTYRARRSASLACVSFQRSVPLQTLPRTGRGKVSPRIVADGLNSYAVKRQAEDNTVVERGSRNRYERALGIEPSNNSRRSRRDWEIEREGEVRVVELWSIVDI